MNPQDDFLSQFRKPPRPEFQRSLYQHLSKGENELIIDSPRLNSTINGAYSPAKLVSRTRQWYTQLTFVATLATGLFLVLLLTVTYSPEPGMQPESLAISADLPTPMPQTPASPVTVYHPPITIDNVRQLMHFATLGEGYLQNVAWSPDGNTLALQTSTGVYLYAPENLDEPQQYIKIDINTKPAPLPFFSNDGVLLVMYDGRQTVILWDVQTQQEQRFDLAAHNIRAISQIELTRDSQVLAVANPWGDLLLLDTQSGTVKSTIRLFTDASQLSELRFNYDGTRLLVGASNKPLLMLEDATGEWQNWQGTAENFGPDFRFEIPMHHQLRFSPNGGQILARFDLDTVLMDAETGEDIARFPFISQTDNSIQFQIGDLSFSPDGTQFATVDDQQLRIWDITSGDSRLVTEAESGSIGTVAFNADWSQVAIVNPRTLELTLMDINTGTVIGIINNHMLHSVQVLNYTADGEYLAASTDWGFTHIWAMQDFDRSPLAITNFSALPYANAIPMLVDPTSGNLTQVTADEVRLLNPETGSIVEAWPLSGAGIDAPAPAMAYSPDGRWLALALSGDGTVTVYDLSTDERTQHTLQVEQGMIAQLTFSADGTTLAISTAPDIANTQPEAHTVELYEVDTWIRVKTFDNFTAPIAHIAFSPVLGSPLLVSADYAKQFVTWNIVTGTPVQVLSDDVQVDAFAFTPDGSLLAAVVHVFNEGNLPSTPQLHFYRVADGELIASFDIDGAANSVTFSPDGAVLTLGMATGVIQMWGMNG